MYFKTNLQTFLKLILALAAFLLLCAAPVADAITPIPDPQPSTNSYGLEATKTQPPPTQAASITIPADGASFSTSPTTVSGICPTGLLVEIFDNNVMVGAINCVGGSFSLQVSLFEGTNQLTANDYDNLDQSGPASNTVTVTYNDSSLTAFANLLTLTSNYGREAANTGATLSWPLLLSGGNGPYAFSINWGDSATNELKSVALSGQVTITHVYHNSGIYHVTIEVTDVNGDTAFLQVVAVANGSSSGSAAASNGSGSSKSKSAAVSTSTTILILPTIICLVLMIPIYWLGRKSQMVALRKKLDKDMEQYAKQKP
jgi:hypothetical protein